MKVDFYQLGGSAVDGVLAAIATRLVADGERLLIVADDEAGLARLDRQLWESGFLPHGVSGSADDARQPVLLSLTPIAANLARNIAIADGDWREAALNFDRAFFLFDEEKLEAARLAWKLLAGRGGVERRYWAQTGGKWAQKG